MADRSTLRNIVNPARAGMIPISVRISETSRRKPRASGDDPTPTPDKDYEGK